MIVRAATLALALSMAVTGPPADAAPSCTVESATNQLVADGITRRAESAKVTLPMLSELKGLGDKATDPHKAIGDQLSPRDAARFATISNQYAGIRLSELVESAYDRDASVVQTMWQTAWKTYTDPSAIPAKNDVAGSLMIVMRAIFPQPELQPRQVLPGQCSVADALALAEDQAVKRAEAFDGATLQRDTAILDELRAKYGVAQGSPLDPSKMTPEDTQTWDRISVELTPAFRELQLARDLQNIRDWWAMANVVHETRREDIRTYGADIQNLGKTMEPMIAGFDDRKGAMLGLWRKVDDKVESHAMRDMEIVAGAIRSQTKPTQRR